MPITEQFPLLLLTAAATTTELLIACLSIEDRPNHVVEGNGIIIIIPTQARAWRRHGSGGHTYVVSRLLLKEFVPTSLSFSPFSWLCHVFVLSLAVLTVTVPKLVFFSPEPVKQLTVSVDRMGAS